MPIFNVLHTVVDLIEADTAEQAIEVMDARLMAAGFDPYYDAEANGYTLPHAFESEPLDEATVAIVREDAKRGAQSDLDAHLDPVYPATLNGESVEDES
jgi:hypothetical protein